MTAALIKLTRPAQWVKNGFVFLPFFFAGELFSLRCWRQALVTFLAFSFMASAVYCLNDVRDVETDRMHPKKRFRPVASGEVSKGAALLLAGALVAASLLLALLALDGGNAAVAGVLLAYLLLNVAYCLRLKQYAIIDVFIISFGFVLRLVSGGISCDIALSPWIVLMTFLLALFLAFAKRRDDVVIYEQSGVVARSSTVNYNIPFMDLTLGIIGAVTIVCYIMYTVSPEVEFRFGSRYVYLTSLFVLAGVLRYLQIAIVEKRSGSPTGIMLHDFFIQACLVCWLVTMLLILYI